MRRRPLLTVPLVAFLAAACTGDRPRGDSAALPGDVPAAAPADSLPAPAPPDSMHLVFTRDEAPVTVARPLPPSGGSLQDALEALVRGPTAAERDAGVQSWFSLETAGALRAVTVDREGRAVVDFEDLRALIPNAGSSAGSAMLLQELNGTVFRFPEIRSVEYRIAGSCAAFWEWLQYDCQVVERPAG